MTFPHNQGKTMKNPIIAQIKESIRHAQAYTPLTFMKDGGVVCPKCTKDNFKLIVQATISQDRSGWEAFGMQPHWEGAPLTCDNCNCQIESEYGYPSADNETE